MTNGRITTFEERIEITKHVIDNNIIREHIRN